MTSVQELMTRQPVAVEVNDSIKLAMSVLRDCDIRHVPVLNRGELTGMLSDRDLPWERAAEPDGDPTGSLEAPVSSIAHGDVLSVDVEAEVTDVIDLMVEHRVGAVPVTRGGGRELVGIVSYVDVLRAARTMF